MTRPRIASMSPVRARAKVLAREDRELRASLVRARREAGLTQREVAERMGVSQQQVNKLERYDADPRLSTLQRYANAVGALYRHDVDIDRGQSIRLADRTSWTGQSVGGHRQIALLTAHSVSVSGWESAPVRSGEVAVGY